MRQKAAVRLLAAAGILATAACQDATTPTDLADRVDVAAQVAQGVEPAALARSVPGFGGFYLDGGTPTVFLTDVRQRPAAEAALARYGYAPASIRVVQGDYSYAELERWFERVTREALAVPGAVFADNDESANRVLVGVEHAGAAASVRGVATRLGIPEGALVVREVEPIQFAITLRDRVDPRVGGIQIHFSNFLCTLGFNAVDGGQSSFITNSHCTDRQGGVEGTTYFQPLSSVDPVSIGTEVEDPDYFRRGECPRGRKCRYSDSSRGAYAGGVNATLGSIARTSGPNNGSLEITGTFTITAEDLRESFTVGETVNKIGRTTGWTQGQVTNTCVTTNVGGSNITQLCQTFVESNQQIVAGGDSGSNVFSPLTSIERELGALTTH